MKTELLWSRRQFVQGLGAVAAGATGLGSAFASESRLNTDISIVYVGTDLNTIDVIDASSRRIIQRVECAQPIALVIAPDKRTLYAANRISVIGGLPMGTVEAFSIASDGRLTLKHRQELSLAATNPGHLALSQDGRSLAVTTESGIYNVLPIDEEGIPQRANVIVKTIGGSNASMFDRNGRILSAAPETSELRILSASESGMLVPSHFDLDRDSLNHLVLHPVADVMYLAHDGAVTCVGYDHQAGTVMSHRQTVEGIALSKSWRAVALAPSGDFLAACDKSHGIVTWAVSPVDGTLRDRRHLSRELGSLDAIAISHKGKSLVAMNRDQGCVSILDLAANRSPRVNSQSGIDVRSPRCLAIA